MLNRLLLERRGELRREQRKSLICFPLEVPEDLLTLRIFFDYQPRTCRERALNSRLVEAAVDTQLQEAEAAGVQFHPLARRRLLDRPALGDLRSELRNLLNLTLTDAEDRFRGRWDQNLLTDDLQEDIISRRWATRGYTAGPLPPGRWMVTLEVHEVISEFCQYHLRVSGSSSSLCRGSAIAELISEQGAAPTSAPPAAREQTSVLPRGWLRGELHCHSRASDGAYEPHELVDRAGALGLDFLALTDHNVTGGLQGLGRLSDAGPVVIPGCEITTFAGHFLCLGLEQAIPWYQGERPLEADQLSQAVRARGGLFGLAHPHVLGDPVCVGCRLAAPVSPGAVDLLEVWSRGYAEQVGDSHALALLDALRGQGHPVVGVAGRDWHGPAQEQATAGRRFPVTVVRAEPDARSLVEAIGRGACYMTVGPVVDLRLLFAGGSAGLGQSAPAGQQEMTARVEVEGLEQRAWLELLSGGARVASELVDPGSHLLERQVQLRPGGLRLELWSEDRTQPLVITNAVS